jgi:hypothetical protein
MGKKGVNADGYRMMTSWCPGECAWCGQKWATGKVIWWHPQWKVAVCTPAHQIATRQAPTYASRRRARGVSSPSMRPTGASET